MDAEKAAFLAGIEIAILCGCGIKPEVAWELYQIGALPRNPGELQTLERLQSMLNARNVVA